MTDKRDLNEKYAAMPWDRIDTVVFDIGRVLMDFQPRQMLADLIADEGLRERLYECMYASPHWLDLDRGTLSYEDAPRVMGGDDPVLQEGVRQVLYGRMARIPEMTEGPAVLRACKEKGKRLYVLSNYHGPAFAYIRSHHAMFDLFDDFCVSADHHLLKPEPAIYEKLIEMTGLDPARTVFIDDTRENIDAAIACGFEGLWYHRPGMLYEFFGLPAQEG